MALVPVSVVKPWVWTISASLIIAFCAGGVRALSMVYDMRATQRAVMMRVSKIEARQETQELRIQAESREAEEDLKEHRKFEH